VEEARSKLLSLTRISRVDMMLDADGMSIRVFAATVSQM
jgi:hypothetical protein